MTFTEAAAEVLRMVGKPLHYKEITEMAIDKNLLSHVGKSPEVTMGARLAALIKKEDPGTPIVRVRPGVFALRDAGKKGKAHVIEDTSSESDVNALEVEAVAAANAMPAAPPSSQAFINDDDEPIVLSGEDALRADLAASGAEMFDDEDDDDEPILGGVTETSTVSGEGASALDPNRRRRRRRGRGRGRGRGDGPEFTVENGSTPRLDALNDGEPAQDRQMDRPMERSMDRNHSDRNGRERFNVTMQGEVALTEGDELNGRELSDAALVVLGAFDRQGPVPIRNVVEQLMRKGRMTGDANAAGTQLSAALRGDNLRRQAQGQRVRFRFASAGRVAPTDWALHPDLIRLEQEALLALERYKDASRKTLLRKVQELPGHAFVELALVALERLGMSSIRPVRRAGSPGGEAHFSAIHRTGSADIRTAIAIRKDGREVGRERVSDLRGALHHYGPATAGWIVTTGQVLSGARDEAAAENAAPLALYDGLSFCRLLDDSGVAVTKTTVSLGIPDLELLETLRGV